MEQIEKIKRCNEELMRFGLEFKSILIKDVFEENEDLDKTNFFSFLNDLNVFPIHVPYKTEMVRKYSDSAMYSYKLRQEKGQNKFVTTVFQKSKSSYFALSVCFFSDNSEIVRPYINVDIFSDNSVKDWIEFIEENKDLEDYSLIEDGRRLGL